MNAVVVVTQDMKDKNIKSEKKTSNTNIHKKSLSNKGSTSIRKKYMELVIARSGREETFLKLSQGTLSQLLKILI